MIILDEIRRRLIVKLSVIREREDASPLKPHQRFGQRPRVRFIVVLNVPGVHHKIRVQLFHRWINLVTLHSVVTADKVMAGGDAEPQRFFCLLCRGGLKSTLNFHPVLAFHRTGFNHCGVFRSGLQSLKFPLGGEVTIRRRPNPVSILNFTRFAGGKIRQTNFTGRTGARAEHFVKRGPFGKLRLQKFRLICDPRKLASPLVINLDERTTIGTHLRFPCRPSPDDDTGLIGPTISCPVPQKRTAGKPFCIFVHGSYGVKSSRHVESRVSRLTVTSQLRTCYKGCQQ